MRHFGLKVLAEILSLQPHFSPPLPQQAQNYR